MQVIACKKVERKLLKIELKKKKYLRFFAEVCDMAIVGLKELEIYDGICCRSEYFFIFSHRDHI